MDVKRGPILFRCDGAAGTSFAPVYQCLTLAAALQRRRRGTHFFSYLDPLSIAQTIHRGNNDWTPAEIRLADPGDLDCTLREARRLGAAAVVLAGEGVAGEYAATVRAAGYLVIVLDDASGQFHESDVVVNPLLGPAMKAYETRPGAQMLLGRKFALVRGLFRRQRTIRANEQPGAFRALVAFGDDDGGNQTALRVAQLLEMPKVEKVSVFARSHHADIDGIEELCRANKGKVEVVSEAKELMTRLVRGHFALTSGDAWSLELACVGIPQLTMPTTAAHAVNAKKLDDEGAGTHLGRADGVSFEALREAVDVVLDDPMERLGMNRCGRNLIDGRGGDRIVNGMEIMLHSPARKQVQRLRIAA